MQSDDLDVRIGRLMIGLFGLPDGFPHVNISMEQLGTWDSMAHINLILAVEQEFGVQFSPEGAAEILSYDDVLEFVRGKTSVN